MNYDMKQSGGRIRQLRIHKGYTQEALARDLNIDRNLLSHVEAGRRGCTVDLLIQLAAFFDVSMDWIVLGKEHGTSGRVQLKSDVAQMIARLEAFEKML